MSERLEIATGVATASESWECALRYAEEHAGEIAPAPVMLAVSSVTIERIARYNASVMNQILEILNQSTR